MRALFKSLLLFFTFGGMEKTVKVQGHRGSRGTHPENTLPAFIEAIEARATGVELDLQVTKDGVVVIYHDYATDPHLLDCAESKRISEYTLAELKQLRYGLATDPEFPQQQALPGTQIPTLEELFLMLQSRRDSYGRALRINLEMKNLDRSIDPVLFADKVVSLVHRFKFEDRVYYSSFDPALLEQVHLRDPGATLSYIIEAADFESLFPNRVLIERTHALGATILSPEYTVLTKEIVQALQNAGLRVIPWTVNDPQSWAELIEMGVNEIITDYPRQLVQFVSH